MLPAMFWILEIYSNLNKDNIINIKKKVNNKDTNTQLHAQQSYHTYHCSIVCAVDHLSRLD